MTTSSIHDLEPQLAANRRYWCGWAGSAPDTDVPTYRTDIEQPLVNGVLRVRHQSLEAAVTQAKQLLDGAPWSWWVGSDSDPGTADGLLAQGAVEFLDLLVMAVDVTTVSDVPAPADLKIVPVTGRAAMTDYVNAYAGPLGFTGDLSVVVDHELNFAYPDVVRLAGVVDGKTVGTCTLSLANDVGALYCIATDPHYRRRGIATALTRRALSITRDSGRRVATLQASSEGEPVYQNIGFKTVDRYRLFHFPK